MMDGNDTKEQPKSSDWPNTIRNRDELDTALDAGEKSGTRPHKILEIANRTLVRLKNG